MKMPSSFVVVVAVAWAGLAACSTNLTQDPRGDGQLAGGNQGGSSSGGGSSSSSSSSSSGGSSGVASGSSSGGSSSSGGAWSEDAGYGGPITTEAGAPETGTGYGFDAAPPVTEAAAPPGTGGTCASPLCATNGNECGCTATDSQGNTVQMGCQAGGECVCLENQQVTTPPFDEDGACTDPSSSVQQFLQSCTCN